MLKLLGVVDLVIRITCQQLNARIRGTGFGSYDFDFKFELWGI